MKKRKRKRQCGDCTACCFYLAVDELKKDNFEACRHCVQGCGIYKKRPQSCKDFNCFWLSGLGDIDKDRPDKLGVIFAATKWKDTLVAHMYMTKRGEMNNPRIRNLVKGVSESMPVIWITREGRRLIRGPKVTKEMEQAIVDEEWKKT